MNIFKCAVLALCLCLGASVACAQDDPSTQGDPPTDTPSGLDIFYPGMSVQDAKKLGAVKSEGSKMTGTVMWNGVPWDAVLLCKNNEVDVVGLKSKHIDAAEIATFLQDMEERLAVPLLLTYEAGGKKELTEFVNRVVNGTDVEALLPLFKKDVETFIAQGNGSMTTVFCHEEMLKTFAENAKAKKVEDDKILKEKFPDYPMYSLRINKTTGGITVISSRFSSTQN